jgi:hypothetical protein
MGMYTEVYFNADLKRGIDTGVIEKIKSTVQGEYSRGLCYNRSCYTPSTSAYYFEYNTTFEQWSLLFKGDLKNYSGEIESFFYFIAPYVDECFIVPRFIDIGRYEIEKTFYFSTVIL